MDSKPTLTIGLIGSGFMGKAHSNAYRQAGRFFDLPMNIRMKTICASDSAEAQEAAAAFGWEFSATDFRAVIADPEIDVIDSSVPGYLHAEVSIAAAEAGKAIWCEKPLGNTLEEASQMLVAVQKAGVPNGIFHNYRKVPAIALAKRFIDEGRLGRIYHFRASYMQDWLASPDFPIIWRLKKELAGSGVHGDLNAHLIDLARHLVGEIDSVTGMLETFIKERPVSSGTGQTDSVTVDDAAAFLARFANGALGTFEASRFAVGRRNQNRFEINGSDGSLAFDLERMNELEFFDNTSDPGRQGFTRILATEGSHPYVGHYWPPGHTVGYEHTFIGWIRDAVIAMVEKREISPSFEDGYRNQIVLDAVERSARSGTWVSCTPPS